MKCKHKLIQYGLINSFIRIIKFGLRKIGIEYEQYLYCTQEMPDLSNYKISLPNGFILKKTNLSDYTKSSLIKFDSQKIDLFQQRYSSVSYRSYGVFNNNILVYSCWISLKFIDLPGVEPNKLRPYEGLLLDAFCHPDYRGMNLQNTMVMFRLSELQKAGKSKAVTILIKENIPSRRSINKAGFLCNQIILMRVIGKKRFIKRISKKIKLV